MSLVNQSQMVESAKTEYNKILYRNNEDTITMSNMDLPHKEVLCQQKSRYKLMLFV